MRPVFRAALAALLSVLFFSGLGDAQAEAGRPLVVGLPYLPEDLDPLAFADPVSRIILENLGSSLFVLDSGGGLRPDLAKGEARELEGGIIEVPIRQDRVFSDGRPATVERIAASLNLYRGWAGVLIDHQRSGGAVNPAIPKQLLESLSLLGEAKPAGRETLQVQYDGSLSRFLRTAARLPVINAALVPVFGEELSKGTLSAYLGPYVLEENRPGRSVVLSKARYFDRDNGEGPWRIEFVVLIDARTALERLRNGQVDIIALPTESILQAIVDDPVVVAVESPFKNLRFDGSQWVLPRKHWSAAGDLSDALLTSVVVLRNTLERSSGFDTSFALYQTHYPRLRPGLFPKKSSPRGEEHEKEADTAEKDTEPEETVFVIDNGIEEKSSSKEKDLWAD